MQDGAKLSLWAKSCGIEMNTTEQFFTCGTGCYTVQGHSSLDYCVGEIFFFN